MFEQIRVARDFYKKNEEIKQDYTKLLRNQQKKIKIFRKINEY